MAKTYEQLGCDVRDVSSRMRGATFGSLSVLADTFRLLENEHGWSDEDFAQFYPQKTVDEAKRQGWISENQE